MRNWRSHSVGNDLAHSRICGGQPRHKYGIQGGMTTPCCVHDGSNGGFFESSHAAYWSFVNYVPLQRVFDRKFAHLGPLKHIWDELADYDHFPWRDNRGANQAVQTQVT